MKKYFVFLSILLQSSVALFAQVQEPKQSQIQELSDTIWTHPLWGTIEAIKFSPDGKYIYAGSDKNWITKIDAVTNKEIYGIKTPSEFKSMDLSKDGKYLFVACWSDSILLINTEDKMIIRQFEVPKINTYYEKHFPVSGVISYDNKYCAVIYHRSNNSKNDMSSVLAWELETGKLVANIDVSTPVSNVLKFSPTENILAVGDYYPTNGKVLINLYEVGTWKFLNSFDGHSQGIEGLRFSPDGNYLASWSGTDQNLIKIWDIKNRKLKQDINALNYLINSVWDVCFLNNNSIVASSENLINSKLRFEFILINLDKETKTAIADGQAYIDISTSNSKNLFTIGDYGIVKLYNLDKTLDVSPENNNPTPILYPNPATKELTISLTDLNNIIVNYRIINNAGQIVQHNASIIQNNTLKINTLNLSKGSYILNLQYGNISKSFNFIIQ